MTLWLRDDKTAQAVELLNRYSFELEGYAAESLIVAWSHHFSAEWIRLAVIEALYQGRYKAVSVEQILAFWQRRGQPLCHFSYEFERMICDRLTTSAGAAMDALPPETRTDQALSRPVPLQAEDLASGEGGEIEQTQGTVTELPTLPATLVAIVAAGQEGKAKVVENPDEAKPLPSAESSAVVSGFRPGAYLETSNAHQANWERLEASKHPIHEFVPPPEPSEFYVRLKSVAHQDGDETVAPESVVE